MFNNIALDVFIGLIFVFLLYSLMATILQEIIATRFAFRAKVLEKAILRMLEDGKTTKDIPYMDRIDGILHIFNLKNLMKGKTVAPWFYAHPLIKYLAEDNWYSKPAYISSANFSKVILDLLKGMDLPASQNLQAIHDSIMNRTIHKIDIKKPDMANPAIKELYASGDLEEKGTAPINDSTATFLKSLWEDSGADLDVFQAKLEQWFNDTMERATGWFKKYTRIVLFFIGLGLAYYFNVDSIAIKRILTNNRPAREQMVSMAIANYQNLNPANLLGKDSSLLDSTYKLVAADADKANNILGLGKPWRDSLNMWKDSVKNSHFLYRMIFFERLNKQLKDRVSQLDSNLTKSNLSLNDFGKHSISDSLEKVIDKDSSELKILLTDPQTDYHRYSKFKHRVQYIKAARAHKWNLYSPNQAGGWETFFGWIITALAVMLGAPFWFDLLSKLISLRGSGTKIDTGNSPAPTPSPATSIAATSTPSSNNNADQEAVG